MKHYLLAVMLLTAGPAFAQQGPVKDPTIWPYTGNPYRYRTAIADSSDRIFYKANVVGIRTGAKPMEAYTIALQTLVKAGYVLAYENQDSLTFTTRAKLLPAWALRSTGAGVWGRVEPDGLVVFYPFYYNEDSRFPIWGGDGKVNTFNSTLAFDAFREAEAAARAYCGTSGKMRYFRMKP